MYSIATPTRNIVAAATAMVVSERPICEAKRGDQPDHGGTGRRKG